MHETITALAAQMPVCAGISESLLASLCSAAEAELDRHLMQDITPQSLGVRYTAAAAMLAASMAVTVSGGGASLTVGDNAVDLDVAVEGDFNLVSVDEVKKLCGGDGSGRIQR